MFRCFSLLLNGSFLGILLIDWSFIWDGESRPMSRNHCHLLSCQVIFFCPHISSLCIQRLIINWPIRFITWTYIKPSILYWKKWDSYIWCKSKPFTSPKNEGLLLVNVSPSEPCRYFTKKMTTSFLSNSLSQIPQSLFWSSKNMISLGLYDYIYSHLLLGRRLMLCSISIAIIMQSTKRWQ